MEKLFSKPKTKKQEDPKLLTKRKPEKKSDKGEISDKKRQAAIAKRKRKQKKRKRIKPEEKLKSSQFRLLNEFLYTNSSSTSLDYFSKRKEDFKTVSELINVV